MKDIPEEVPAKEAYRYFRFPKWRAYAEESGADWFILSTGYGLIEPDKLIKDYDDFVSTACGDPNFKDRLRNQASEFNFAQYKKMVLVCCDQNESKSDFEKLVKFVIGDGKAQYEFRNVC